MSGIKVFNAVVEMAFGAGVFVAGAAEDATVIGIPAGAVTNGAGVYMMIDGFQKLLKSDSDNKSKAEESKATSATPSAPVALTGVLLRGRHA